MKSKKYPPCPSCKIELKDGELEILFAAHDPNQIEIRCFCPCCRNSCYTFVPFSDFQP